MVADHAADHAAVNAADRAAEGGAAVSALGEREERRGRPSCHQLSGEASSDLFVENQW